MSKDGGAAAHAERPGAGVPHGAGAGVSGDGGAAAHGGAVGSGPPPVYGKDPLQSFRGVLMGALIVEAITVALAMLLVIKFNGGVTSAAGWTVMALVVALLVTCGLLRHTYSLAVGFCLQLVMIACAFLSVPLAIIGVVFALVWGALLWMRNDVAKRKAAGLLPAQQPPPEPEGTPEAG